MKINRHSWIAAFALAVLGTPALASGTHAHGGGHVHQDDSAIGAPGKAADVRRTVKVDMTDDMRFKPANIVVPEGQTVRFVVRNSGRIKHEFVLGTVEDLKEHYEAMKKYPEMEHAEENMVTVAPGKTGEVIWKFTRGGRVDFACLQPGHYEAGMKGQVVVAAQRRSNDGHTDHKH